MLISVDCSAFLCCCCGFVVAGLPVFVYFVRLLVTTRLFAFLGCWPNGLVIWNVIIYCWLGFWFLLVWPTSLLVVWVVARRLVVGVVGSHVVFVGDLGCSCFWFSLVQVVPFLYSAVYFSWVIDAGVLGFSLSYLCSLFIYTYCGLTYFFYAFTSLYVSGLWSILNFFVGLFALLSFAGFLVDYTTSIKDSFKILKLESFFWIFWIFWVLVLKHRSMLLGVFVLLTSSGPELLGFFFLFSYCISFFALSELKAPFKDCVIFLMINM